MLTDWAGPPNWATFDHVRQEECGREHTIWAGFELLQLFFTNNNQYQWTRG